MFIGFLTKEKQKKSYEESELLMYYNIVLNGVSLLFLILYSLS